MPPPMLQIAVTSMTARARSRGNGLTPGDRARWARTYGETPYQQLPWYSPDPYPPLVRVVQEGWLTPPGPFLDVGCGAGSNVLWMSGLGFRATGVDVAPGAIAAANSRRTPSTRSAKFLVDDFLISGLPAAHFRGGGDAGCFHTLPPRKRGQYVASLARLLRPDAKFLLSWVAREETGTFGPPHRLSVDEVARVFEPAFLLERVEFRPRVVRSPVPPKGSERPLTTLAGYTARLIRRRTPQPPPR
jgi:SAM-dependent methyltransferase